MNVLYLTIFLETPYPQRAWARLLKPDQPASTPVEIAEGKSQAIGTVLWQNSDISFNLYQTNVLCHIDAGNYYDLEQIL